MSPSRWSRASGPKALRRATRPRLELGTVLLCALAAACGRHEETGAAGRNPPPIATSPATAEASYLAPPEATSATLRSDGTLEVTGHAEPGAVILVASPTGTRYRAAADRRGAWKLQLPMGERPNLYAVSAMTDGRVLHAEGALVTAPGALSPALTVRAGFAALPLVSPQGAAAVDVTAVDFDPGGFLAVAGRAPPRSPVALAIDGAGGAVGESDAAGRYALLPAGRRLTMGPHRLQVRAGDQSTEREVDLIPPGPLATPFVAHATANGWRLEWALNGGGVQTTLILSP